MLDTYEKFRMIDKGKKNDFFCEVNWELDNKEINECKVVRVTFPNGDESFVEVKHLNELLFAIGKESTQQRLIPQTITPVHVKDTLWELKSMKDVKKGEMLRFTASVSVPCPFYKQNIIGKVKK